MFCGFAIRSREIVICYGLGGLQIPWFDRSNLFYDGFQIRRDAWRCMGRLAGVWDGWRGGEFSGHKKSRGILEGESPRQLKFQRPV